LGVETVTTVTVNNNCQTYLPRNRFSRCSAFCFKRLCVCVVSPLCRHTTCPATTAATDAPPTRILSRYLRKVLQGTKSEGLGGVGRRRGGRRSDRGRRGKGREKEGGRDYLGPSSVVQPPPHPHLLLLLLPIVEPWGPVEAAPCLAALQPLYHSNLLIVGAQLAHGGFLLEPPDIN